MLFCAIVCQVSGSRCDELAGIFAQMAEQVSTDYSLRDSSERIGCGMLALMLNKRRQTLQETKHQEELLDAARSTTANDIDGGLPADSVET